MSVVYYVILDYAGGYMYGYIGAYPFAEAADTCFRCSECLWFVPNLEIGEEPC